MAINCYVGDDISTIKKQLEKVKGLTLLRIYEKDPEQGYRYFYVYPELSNEIEDTLVIPCARLAIDTSQNSFHISGCDILIINHEGYDIVPPEQIIPWWKTQSQNMCD